ncbi:rCG27053 [Rattus norvegicus]|uniref:RCG27053 n=1 Tax=Rattus norvegicus TaxID=10116 RepID=A6HNL9_RAT|nr:rCG27053 [Rattus norvegicus]
MNKIKIDTETSGDSVMQFAHVGTGIHSLLLGQLLDGCYLSSSKLRSESHIVIIKVFIKKEWLNFISKYL